MIITATHFTATVITAAGFVPPPNFRRLKLIAEKLFQSLRKSSARVGKGFARIRKVFKRE